MNFIQAQLADRSCKGQSGRKSDSTILREGKKRVGVVLSGLFIYLCKPAYGRTDIFAVRSDLRATNQVAVQPQYADAANFQILITLG